MWKCELVDYSGRSESLIKLYDCAAVTADDLASIKEILPEHSTHVYEGDVLTIYIVDNRTEGIKGLLSIWHRKENARLNMGDGNIWGDWEVDAKLLVTEDFAVAEDKNGMAVMGRIAYNNHGIRGLYSRGSFFTLSDHEIDAMAINQ